MSLPDERHEPPYRPAHPRAHDGPDRDHDGAGRDGDRGGAGRDGDRDRAGQDGGRDGAGRDGDRGGAGRDGDQDGAGRDGDRGGAGRDGDQDGAGRDGDHDDPPEHEAEVRLLLERAVPHLVAPDGRMRQVRRRVVLRRRRRAALAAAVTGVAAVAVLASVLRTAPTGPGTTSVTPAASSGTAAHPPAPAAGAPTVAPTEDGGAHGGPVVMDFRLSGVVVDLRLAGRWWRGQVPGEQSGLFGFAATQPLASRDRPVSCPDPLAGAFSCAPVRHLVDGGVLVSLQVSEEQGGDLPDGAFTVSEAGPGALHETCRDLGGDRELVARGRHDSAARVAVDAYACMRHATSSTVALVRKSLATAGIHGAASDAPSAGGAHR